MDDAISMDLELIQGLGAWFRRGTPRRFEPYILAVARNAPHLKRIGHVVEKSDGARVRTFWDIVRERTENGEMHTTLVNIGWKAGDAE